MKKIIFGLCAVVLFLVPQISQADGYSNADVRNQAEFADAVIPDGSTDALSDTLLTATNYVLGFLAALAILVIVISGIMYITASGDQERVDNAKKWLLYAIIGLVVALLAFVIVYAVSEMLGAG